MEFRPLAGSTGEMSLERPAFCFEVERCLGLLRSTRVVAALTQALQAGTTSIANVVETTEGYFLEPSTSREGDVPGPRRTFARIAAMRWNRQFLRKWMLRWRLRSKLKSQNPMQRMEEAPIARPQPGEDRQSQPER